MALAAYRDILRSMRIAFQGDMHVLGAARAFARKHFDDNHALTAGSDEYAKSITHAHDVARILRENVVQGQATEANKYQLRIHEHTERGDNEDIKKAQGKTTLGGSKCCSA